ncbi:RluA family pseudouridine synthase [Blattabacterium cuenoti]|uniref:RluA family pseudouridine synthase n=1 Tax=Blattabacterium cuenoti TaxID=1653831 RepID=UPI001EEC0557|nr:RluA family pseudouridine synthase [Blattabacterium cuenoti]
MKKLNFVVKTTQKLIRIDKYLKQYYIKDISRNQIQYAIKSGKILVNKQYIKNNYIVKPCDYIEGTINPSVEVHIEEYNNIHEENIPINIIYQDEDLAVINKPAGMVVHPGIKNQTSTLINGIIYHFKKNINLYRCGLIHRIDKDTSGLLVFAKNEYTQEYLSKQFFHKTVKRQYIALVWGNLKYQQGTISGYIGKDPKNRIKMKLFNQFSIGRQYSITHYKVIERFKHLTSIICCLETGKTHQIRTHFKFLGHPIFNDKIYGGNKIPIQNSNKYITFLKNCLNILNRQALHSCYLSFVHPKNQQICSFICPIPKEWSLLLQQCRYYYKFVI